MTRDEKIYQGILKICQENDIRYITLCCLTNPGSESKPAEMFAFSCDAGNRINKEAHNDLATRVIKMSERLLIQHGLLKRNKKKK